MTSTPGGLESVADGGLRGQAEQEAGGGVVGIGDGGAGGAAGGLVEGGEEPALGLAVGLEALVEVEMVAGQVREDGDVEGDLVEAVEGEAVAGGFDDGVLAARLDHLAEEALDLGRLGGGHAVGVAVDVGPGHVGIDGAETADAGAGGFEDGREDVGGGRLAVGAGDADDGEVAAGVAVEGGRGLREGHARIFDGDDGLLAGEVSPCSPTATLSTTTAAAPASSASVKNAVAIDGKAGNGDEERALLDAAGVVVDVLDDGRRRRHAPSSAPGISSMSEARIRASLTGRVRRRACQLSAIKGTAHRSRKLVRIRAVAPQMRCSPQR